MTSDDRLRLIFHGAIVMLVGLMCGLPTVLEEGPEALRDWHTAHEALIMMGVWILAMSSVVPALVLEARDAKALRWSLLAMGYGFTVGLLAQGVTGARAFEPGTSLGSVFAFFPSTLGILGAVMSVLLTLKGARAALKVAPPG